MTKFLKKTRLFDDILVDQQEDENELDGLTGSTKKLPVYNSLNLL